MVAIGTNGSPQTVKLFVGSILPTTEPIATKTPPLNPQWSNWSVGSHKPFESGQKWLPQQQNKSEDKSIQSISGSAFGGKLVLRRCTLSLALLCQSKRT